MGNAWKPRPASLVFVAVSKKAPVSYEWETGDQQPRLTCALYITHISQKFLKNGVFKFVFYTIRRVCNFSIVIQQGNGKTGIDLGLLSPKPHCFSLNEMNE